MVWAFADDPPAVGFQHRAFGCIADAPRSSDQQMPPLSLMQGAEPDWRLAITK